MKKKLTPEQFIEFCKIMNHDPDTAVKAIAPLAWPSFLDVARVAESQADGLRPTDKNLPLHAWLFELSNWARKRIR